MIISRQRLLAGLTAVFLLTSVVGPPALLASNAQKVNTLKAAFIANFARYISWPEDTFKSDNSPLYICFDDLDAFGLDAARSIEGKMINGHPIIIGNHSDGHSCHILYLTNGDQLERLSTEHRGDAILTISSDSDFLDEGGMIRFRTKRGKLRFSINRQTIQEAGLKVSSYLLELADNG